MPDNMVQSQQLEPAIDFEFISALDGNNITKAYVPEGSSDKGVCIALGFDLAEVSDTKLRHMGLNPTLIGKLYPYLGRKADDAQAYLVENPLKLSLAETSAINMGLKYPSILKLMMHYDKVSNTSFSDLPPCWQTVIASVSFQYECLAESCPVFWQNIIAQKWEQALNNLRNFESQYAQRREQETQYIIERMP